MFVVVADGTVVFSSDIDDVAWQDCEDRKSDFEKVYVEEVYLESFDTYGKYKTVEGDIIALDEIVNAEQYYRDDGQRPTAASKSPKKGKKRIKTDRSYIDEKIDSLYVSGVKRLLSLIGISFDENNDEVVLKELLLEKLKTIKKQNDDHTESVFQNLNIYSDLAMGISQMTRFESEYEAKILLLKMLDKLAVETDEDMDEYYIEELLFDNLITHAERMGKSAMVLFDELKER